MHVILKMMIGMLSKGTTLVNWSVIHVCLVRSIKRYDKLEIHVHIGHYVEYHFYDEKTS